MSEKNYIFGYGSLINSKSRDTTGATNTVLPVRIKGLKRTWTQPIHADKVIALEVKESKDCTCNGVLLEIPSEELPKFDKREAGYTRIAFPWSKIDIRDLQKPVDKSGKVWVYVKAKEQTMPPEYKIIQSYVDVILSGCLEYGEEFTREFIETTYNWDSSWINDRQAPIYPRALKHDLPLEQIDTLLQDVIDYRK
jgi:cation transport regulator ChaC